ncbi:MAG: hypothetical protein H6707_21285 [Deltaproteobacteria bacterium]|nr:hypothetical protein [Deltaproteobacteria bacterium]
MSAASKSGSEQTASVGIRRLTDLVERLQSEGSDRERLRAAECALRFKRSWIDLAAALSEVRERSAYQRWGYQDLMSYAASELGIRSATVDKLLVSYTTLRRHAPKRLAGRDAGEIPSYQALDYLARATGELRSTGKPPRDAPDAPPSDGVLRALRKAVFEEGQSVRQLRDQFDPVLRPRTAQQQQQLALRKLSAAARRLIAQLDEVDELEALDAPRLRRVLDTLREQTEVLAEQLAEIAPLAEVA